MIGLSRIKRSKFLKDFIEKHGDRHVRIWSAQWSCYWRHNRSGYTKYTHDAGVYTLRDAFDGSGHCGAEKGIYYEFADGEKLTQEPKGKAKLLLRI